ncbi:hypothetical protein BKA57DRAFT_452810 [Linnemannia elongata]|nr:hypothetical protein BKA57DRAFT_452810 [Linnemannia elongata]
MDKFKVLTLVNFIIGSTALSFQVGVLYPWHHQLDGDFKELEKKHESRLQLFHNRKWEKLREIDSKLDSLVKQLGEANNNPHREANPQSRH